MSSYKVKCVLLPLGLIAIAAVAALSAFTKPAEVEYSSSEFALLAEAVASDFRSNEALADSAPQQQVVAGWATKDFLNVLALQAEETNLRITEAREAASSDAQRTSRLLGLGVLALCWIGIWMPVGRRPDTEVLPVSPAALAGPATPAMDLPPPV